MYQLSRCAISTTQMLLETKSAGVEPRRQVKYRDRLVLQPSVIQKRGDPAVEVSSTECKSLGFVGMHAKL